MHGAQHAPEIINTLVRSIRAAGISLGVVIVAGCGGAHLEDAHTRQTVAMLRDAPLESGDLVYLVDLDAESASAFDQALSKRRLVPMPAAARSAQVATMRAELASLRRDRGVKIVPYALDKQL
jgi:hypothetical protein